MIEFQYISSRFYLIYKTRSLSGITFLSLCVISLDTTSFLPRDDLPGGDLPVGSVSWSLPTTLSPRNNIELNNENEPRISVDWADDPYLEKKEVMRDFAVDAMNKVAKVLGIRWAELKGDDY